MDILYIISSFIYAYLFIQGFYFFDTFFDMDKSLDIFIFNIIIEILFFISSFIFLFLFIRKKKSIKNIYKKYLCIIPIFGIIEIINGLISTVLRVDSYSLFIILSIGFLILIIDR